MATSTVSVEDSIKVLTISSVSDKIQFTFEKDVVVEIDIEDFPVHDKEEVTNILEWMETNHKENKLLLSELLSFKIMQKNTEEVLFL